jgi:pyruvate dehydrogenase E1 component beta subunit
MLAAIRENSPVIFLEHKLLADYWRDYLGSGGRKTVAYDVPEEGARGAVPDTWEPIPLGKARVCQEGSDLAIISVGVGIHRSIEAASQLEKKGIKTTVIDLRTISPLDIECICQVAAVSKKVIVVDEDYEAFGLSGEISALLLENGISCAYRRVCTKSTIPYSREMEDEALPNVKRIIKAAESLFE